jgi:hypothetical protein
VKEALTSERAVAKTAAAKTREVSNSSTAVAEKIGDYDDDPFATS